MYARYAHPRNITVERLLEISHLVVRDHSHILSREPPAPQPPAPSSLLAPTNPFPQLAKVFKTIQYLTSKFAEASASTKLLSAAISVGDARASSTVVSNALGTQLPPTSASTASGVQVPPSVSATTSGTARPHTPNPLALKYLSSRLCLLSALKVLRQTPRLRRLWRQCPRTPCCKNRAPTTSRSRKIHASASIHQPT